MVDTQIQSSPPINSNPINSRRLVALFVLLIIFISIPITVYLVRRKPGEFEIRTRAQQYATLNMITDQNEYGIGETFTLEIELNTGDEPPLVPVTGVDVILNYNSSLVETAVDKISEGSIFDTYPAKDVDSSTGRVIISGGASAPENFFTGTGIFASIEFTAVAQGDAEFSFVWGGPTETTDTNIVGLLENQAVERLVNQPAIKTVGIGLPAPSLTLESTSYEYAVDDVFDVVINLNTGMTVSEVYNDTVGTDVILTYDPDVLEGNGISVGSLYDNYPKANIDVSQGRIEISGGMASVGTYFAGAGVFATIEFVARAEGTSGLDFVWDGVGATADTNIVGPGPVDLLVGRPESKSFVIGGGPPPPEKHWICQAESCIEVDGAGTNQCGADADCQAGPGDALLNFRLNLLERHPSMGSKGAFKIRVLEVPGWHNNLEIVNLDGTYLGLVLDGLSVGSAYTFYIKGPSHLAKKAPSVVTLAAGNNPSTGYLDFGDIVPGDIFTRPGEDETDGVINSFDAGEVFVHWNTGAPGESAADFNGDQQVNAYDIGIVFKYFGSEEEI